MRGRARVICSMHFIDRLGLDHGVWAFADVILSRKAKEVRRDDEQRRGQRDKGSPRTRIKHPATGIVVDPKGRQWDG